MGKQDIIKYWIKTSEDDLSSMESIFNAGNYDWALFIGHLSLEKIMKALWVKNNTSDVPPKTHNLKKIADEANCTKEFSEGYIKKIKELHQCIAKQI